MNLQRNGEIEDALSPARAIDRAGWAARITAAWQKSIDGILETGRELIAAKAKLEHGEFEAMIESDLPFGASTARRLKAIAEDPKFANRAHAHALPNSWMTLYELTKLDDATFDSAIAAGAIRPDMERKDAMLLRTAERRGERLAKIETLAARSRPLPDVANAVRTWPVIYADPPWAHRTWSEAGKQKSPEQHYPTMSHDALCAMPVIELGARGTALARLNFILQPF